MRTWQSPYEIVADGSDEGGTSHCIRFLMKQNAPQARLMKQNAPQARFFDQVLMGTLSY